MDLNDPANGPPLPININDSHAWLFSYTTLGEIAMKKELSFDSSHG